ncbi:uncharacterized protein PADG_04536 [Paracoccidioides brasiliensis Pb18]|uniref:UDP-glucoronosyl and UDP-glucosyl transferase family protein n=1 Tax=Paracoccidioides brasiliensis (strain Pb18) TaxID=502780 RepID=C1GC14_PARBD|nr:uncharacterized protein PADG_04536 [Paracoccidioides brasiliensis Pb18]EEH48457.1 hypothetical protein PADG_04536 [Paracoccidioides brasiliensis Pb18]
MKNNNRVLFLTNCESGLANVHLATAHSILTSYPDTEVHFVSFPRLAPFVENVNKYATRQSPSTGLDNVNRIILHELSGPSYGKALVSGWTKTHDDVIHGPGLSGLSHLTRFVERAAVPWNGSEYVGLYREVCQLINEIDPAVTVIDTLFAPGADAVTSLTRKYILMSANALSDNFAGSQPRAAMLWKFPAFSSGYPFPVPWYLIPANILYNLRLLKTIAFGPLQRELTAHTKSQGLGKPRDVFNIYDKNVPWLSPSLVESDYPLVIPSNVTPCGPIFLSLGSIPERDPELAAWLERAPTVLVNLGSMTTYSQADAEEMVGAIRILLDNTGVQVLWKFFKRHDYSDDFLIPLADDLASGRVRIEGWISVEPASLLESGHIVLSVHHGGSNSFHEAIGTGIPQIALPLWVDCYGYAVRAEWLEVGIWGSRKTAPSWTAKELGQAFLTAVGDGAEAKFMAEKARKLGELAKKAPGRVVAARKIVEYMKMKLGESEESEVPSHNGTGPVVKEL